jgi:acyl-[acyl carrier protein]--UDP-N-acetylglucosamine O-acyltransferase
MIHPTALIGDNAQWRGRETKYGVEIHPSSKIGAYTCVDAGSERPTIIGPDNFIMKQVHIAHGVQTGKDVEVSTGTVIAGEVTIQDGVRIGIGALLKPYITIGRGARIGMGAVVISDVEPFTCVGGNPARYLYSLCRGGCHKRVENQKRCPQCSHSFVGGTASMAGMIKPEVYQEWHDQLIKADKI